MEKKDLVQIIEKYALVDPDAYGEEARKIILDDLKNMEKELEEVHILLKETMRKFNY